MIEDKYFIGHYGEYSIDTNGRMVLPAKIKAEKGDQLGIMAATTHCQEKCLKLIPYKRISEQIDALMKKKAQSLVFNESQKYENLIMEYCCLFESLLTVDSQHRIVIPKKILQLVNIDFGDTLDVVGIGNALVYTKKKK